MSSSSVLASSLTAADLTRETFSVGGVGLDVIFTPGMLADLEIDGEVRTVEVGPNGLTEDMLPNALVDQYTDAMGVNTDGVIGFAADGTAVLLDRLAPASPHTQLDSSSFAATFAQQTGGKVLANAKRVSVVPSRDRLSVFGMT